MMHTPFNGIIPDDMDGKKKKKKRKQAELMGYWMSLDILERKYPDTREGNDPN
jgi:type II secretory pathway component PulJ